MVGVGVGWPLDTHGYTHTVPNIPWGGTHIAVVTHLWLFAPVPALSPSVHQQLDNLSDCLKVSGVSGNV